tara:strand:- start:2242 stop:2619 length:378 start_codon:yes stop_codon:yes gene_type:complete
MKTIKADFLTFPIISLYAMQMQKEYFIEKAAIEKNVCDYIPEQEKVKVMARFTTEEEKDVPTVLHLKPAMGAVCLYATKGKISHCLMEFSDGSFKRTPIKTKVSKQLGINLMVHKFNGVINELEV